MSRLCLLRCTLLVFAMAAAWLAANVERQAQAAQQDPGATPDRGGVVPLDADGKSLNLDFEQGNLSGWEAQGDAFEGQPIEGDTVAPRRGDMQSAHAGKFWIGTFERTGDRPRGTLASAPFAVTHPYASFLVAGGPHAETRVELVRQNDNKVIFSVSGDETENLKPVAVDLRAYADERIFIRLVDDHDGHWGHINFDDFRFHDSLPEFPGRDAPPPLDVFPNAGLPPKDAAAAMTVPPGFHVGLFAGEPDVQQPIGFCIDDRGRLWVAEAYSYPVKVPDEEARDRILVFEDRDGDGAFDQRTVFIDKLNLVSGIEVGFGGVWVGAAPELLFIPDADKDDVPDGPPQVLLDGWGHQDSHETLNAFTWGPDGWLYGCHGVFTHSLVGKPGTPESERTPLNAAIWRYHPTRHEFEIFAHGTSNPWGIDFNDRGQAFLTACVIPHLYHVIQGGRYQRQAGGHFNAYTYADIQTIARHRHWVGDTPHSGNSRSDSAGGGHAHSGAMIYLGGAWPQEYRDQIFMNNIHGARINMDRLWSEGSGYVGDRAPDFLLANDSWSQIMNLQYGPDGQVYMIDWYDQNQCHHGEVEAHDRSNGRIFKISYDSSLPLTKGEPEDVQQPRTVSVDLSSKSDQDLVDLQLHANDWYVRHTRRILQERGPNPAVHEALDEIAFDHPDSTRRLRGLWALHATSGLDEGRIDRALNDADPYVRAWTIQLSTEQKSPTEAILGRFTDLAKDDPSPVVRLYLASALERLEAEDGQPILEALVGHAEDAADHNLPLMYWYAAERVIAEGNEGPALELADRARIGLVSGFMVRRLAQLGTPEALDRLVARVRSAPDADARVALLTEINKGQIGKRHVEMPGGWRDLYGKLIDAAQSTERAQLNALGLTFGDERAISAVEEVLSDTAGDTERREQALASLVRSRVPGLPRLLFPLLDEPALRRAALRSLAAYDDERTPEVILSKYSLYNVDERRDALSTLTSRIEYAHGLLTAIAEMRVPAADLSADMVRQLRNLDNEELNARIVEVWGTVNDTPEERLRLIEHYKEMLASPAQVPPDLALGRAIFANTCQRCHILFGVGNKVGPELTGSNRANLDYLLSNVLDPSAVIGKDYRAVVIQTTDGRVLTGLITAENQDAVTLVTANETVIVPQSEIEVREVGDKSMMPDDQWKDFSDDAVRSLVAYLASPQQVPLLATPDTVALLFNGRDLAGWNGNLELWSVEDGQIVGRTRGLDHNEFLVSDLLAGDFRLSFEVKLAENQGNSGVQFRSQPLPDGEVQGYQADIGAGWWGKLYEERGRGLLWDQSGEAFVQPGEWNRYEILATGSRIQTWINGRECVDMDDPDGAARGQFALQLHSGGPTEVRFRDLRLELIPAPAEPAGE